jgi:hypothetical protein
MAAYIETGDYYSISILGMIVKEEKIKMHISLACDGNYRQIIKCDCDKSEDYA